MSNPIEDQVDDIFFFHYIGTIYQYDAPATTRHKKLKSLKIVQFFLRIRVIACPANSMYGPNATSLVFRSAISLNWHSFELFMHTVCQRRSACPKKLSAADVSEAVENKYEAFKSVGFAWWCCSNRHIVGSCCERGEKYQKIAKLFGRRVVTKATSCGWGLLPTPPFMISNNNANFVFNKLIS